jgi:hypothetical protein
MLQQMWRAAAAAASKRVTDQQSRSDIKDLRSNIISKLAARIPAHKALRARAVDNLIAGTAAPM